MLKVSILTVGDEILIGQITNTNAAWISQKCVEIGATVFEHRTVGDSENSIMVAVDELLKVSDVLLITGGLGPTNDDLTKPTLSKYFNDVLVFDNNVFEWVMEFFLKRGILEISERNRNLAFVPSKCKPLKNELGTAPGMLFNEDGKIVVSMPGVPKEMKFIMNTYVLPLIKEKISANSLDVHIFKVIQTCGIPESILADKLEDIEKHLNGLNIAYLPSYKGVRLRLEAKNLHINEAEKRLQELTKIIYAKIGEYIYGEGEISLSETVGKLLSGKKETVAVAESCTGGLLGGEFTINPGSSNYFIGGVIAYSNIIKSQVLGVKQATLDNFGAVSEQTAVEMASNVRRIFNSTYGLSITGIAGPTGGTPLKPVGTVWIGISSPNKTYAKHFQFAGDRDIIRERSVAEALTMLYLEIKGLVK